MVSLGGLASLSGLYSVGPLAFDAFASIGETSTLKRADCFFLRFWFAIEARSFTSETSLFYDLKFGDDGSYLLSFSCYFNSKFFLS